MNKCIFIFFGVVSACSMEQSKEIPEIHQAKIEAIREKRYQKNNTTQIKHSRFEKYTKIACTCLCYPCCKKCLKD